MTFAFRSWYKLFVMDGTPQTVASTRIATFKISLEDYEQVEAVASRDDRSVSAVLRLAVREYLESRADKEAAA